MHGTATYCIASSDVRLHLGVEAGEALLVHGWHLVKRRGNAGIARVGSQAVAMDGCECVVLVFGGEVQLSGLDLGQNIVQEVLYQDSALV